MYEFSSVHRFSFSGGFRSRRGQRLGGGVAELLVVISFWLLDELVSWLVTSVFVVGNSSIQLAGGGCGSSLPMLHVPGGTPTNTAGSRCGV